VERRVTKREIAKLIQTKKSLRIDLGCGANKQPNTFGVDARKLPGVDLVHDLVNDMPWPLPTSCARVVFMSHFWEHVLPTRTIPFMAELHRICQPGAQVLIAAPYGVEFRFVQDPTHCNPSNEATFCYWDKLHESGLWYVYEPPVFHLDAFEVIPVGSGRDFNAFLTCCKPKEAPCRHPKCPSLVGTRKARRGGSRGKG
jgi:hypothetical protein